MTDRGLWPLIVEIPDAILRTGQLGGITVHANGLVTIIAEAGIAAYHCTQRHWLRRIGVYRLTFARGRAPAKGLVG